MSARRAAAELLATIERGVTLDDALEQTTSFDALEGRERAFARALTTAVLRWQGGLDAVLAHFLQRPLPDTAGKARALLRLGAAQLLVMETPAHAAVSATVDAAHTLPAARPFVGMINAVLRKVSREGPALLAALPPGALLPAWFFTRWRAVYGDDTAAAIALALRQEPPLDFSVKADAAAWAERLHGVLTPTGSVRLPSPRGEGTEGSGEAPPSTELILNNARAAESSAPHPTPNPLPSRAGGVSALPGYDEGAWWVQDAAAALPARLLGDVRGKTVIDLCAAPGGKTLQLAAAGARVIAVDRSEPRLQTLRNGLTRARLDAEIVCADAVNWRPREPVDAILLDAPCTATGTLRRHPDIAWLRRPDDIRKLAWLQARLLTGAAEMLKPGGVLVYAVCSIEPEEGPSIIEAALKSGNWKRAPLARGEIAGADEFITPQGDLRTLPSGWPEIGGLDGFFAARLVRV